MPQQLPRSDKRVAGRTSVGRTPVEVRGFGVQLEQHHRDYICERLGMRLAKFAAVIERITVRIEDENGPKGGADHVCRIQAALSHFAPVHVEARHEQAIPAFDLAVDALELAVHQRIDKVRSSGASVRRRQSERPPPGAI